MNSEIKTRFLELKVTGQRAAMDGEQKRENDLQLIIYLKSIIENKVVTDFEDIGFCYWNISDNYALLKEGCCLLDNHQKFHEFINNKNTIYLYWLVCDATQKLSLEKEGYGDFWWSLYRKAIERNTDNKHHFAEFNAHRAALYTTPILPHTNDNFKYAKSNFEKFLCKTKETREYQFYKIIYLSLISRFASIDDTELLNLCKGLFTDLSSTKTTSEFLIGEWQSFITPPTGVKRSTVGIISAINCFIHKGESKIAEDLYNEACDIGLPRNHYIETRLK